MSKRRLRTDDLHAWYQEGLRTGDAIKPRVSAILGHPVSNAELDKLLRQILPKESHYQKKIMDWIAAEYPNAFVRKISSGIYSEGGFPDVLAIIDGRYIGIEVKRPYIGEPSRLQLETIKQIKQAGGRAGLACFPFEAKEIIG